MNADKFIVLTDIDGLYDGNPDKEETKVIQDVEPHEDLGKYISKGNKEEGEGRGGMGSKLGYAQMAAAKNIPTYIVNGKKENIIIDIIEGKKVGTKVSL